MSVNLAYFFNFVYEDELKKLEHEFNPFIYSVFLPSKNNGFSQNELILEIDSISACDIIGHFDCFHYNQQLKKLIFRTKEEADKHLKRRNGTIMGEKYTLKQAKAYPRLIFRVSENNLKNCQLVFNHILDNFKEETMEIKIPEGNIALGNYLEMRYNQEKLKCEKNFRVFMKIDLMKNILRLTFATFDPENANKLKQHLGNVIVSEGIVTEKWKPIQDVFEKFDKKEFLQKVEGDFQVSIHLLQNTKEINVTGEKESIENFKKEYSDWSITIHLDSYLRKMMHNNKKQKIMEICSKNNVTWQTKPLNLKILKFIGNGKSLETVGKLIDELIEEIK